MIKKDYVLIAEVIARSDQESTQRGYGARGGDALQLLTDNFIQALQAQNPSFDPVKFNNYIVKLCYTNRKRGNPVYAYNVYVGRKLIDTVFYSQAVSVDEVRRSLINHDGYPSSIRVVKARR